MTGIVFAPFPSFETALARLLRMRLIGVSAR